MHHIHICDKLISDLEIIAFLNKSVFLVQAERCHRAGHIS